MGIQHILPNFIYTAQQLHTMSEGAPGGMPLKRWKAFVFQKRREDGRKPLKFQKGAANNSAYRVAGADYLKFISQF